MASCLNTALISTEVALFGGEESGLGHQQRCDIRWKKEKAHARGADG
jgi:hypothetical protein